MAYNTCVDALRDSFVGHDGAMTRDRFRAICRKYKVDMLTAQAIFEASGLTVDRKNNHCKKPGDRFCWEVKG